MPSESVVQWQIVQWLVPLVGAGFDGQTDCLAFQTREPASALAEFALAVSVAVASVAAEFAAVLLVETV